MMKKIKFLSIVALTTVLSLAAKTEDTANQNDMGTISGVVLDENLGTPVEGISVSIQHIDGDHHKETTLSSEGVFTFKVVPGTYDVLVNIDGENPNYAPLKHQNVAVKPGQNINLDLVLKAATK